MFSKVADFMSRHPWWIAGGVLFLVIVIYFAWGGEEAPSQTVVNTGPSDTAVAANAALSMKQMEASYQTGIANILKETQIAQAASDERMAKIASEFSLSALTVTKGAEITQSNNELAAAVAAITANQTISLANINQTAGVINNQTTATVTMHDREFDYKDNVLAGYIDLYKYSNAPWNAPKGGQDHYPPAAAPPVAPPTSYAPAPASGPIADVYGVVSGTYRAPGWDAATGGVNFVDPTSGQWFNTADPASRNAAYWVNEHSGGGS